MFWLMVTVGMILLASAAYAGIRGAPWVPTRRADVDRLIGLCHLKPGQTFYELGCGDARVCCEVAKRTGARAVGVELSLLLYLAARLRVWLGGHQRVRIFFGDARKADLSQAQVIYLFLMPKVNALLAPTLAHEVEGGAMVVSYVWPIPGLNPKMTDGFAGRSRFYVYK